MSDNLYWYTMVIEDGDKRHAYGVHFPDLPGCFSAGDTLEEAAANARDAVLLFIEDRLERGEPLPEPRPVAAWKRDRRYAGARWTWMRAYIDLDTMSGPPERINVMVRRAALARIDAAATREHKSRSAFMVEAALERACGHKTAAHENS